MNPIHRTNVSNVLVIGSGGAGLWAAIAAHAAECEVVVVGKGLPEERQALRLDESLSVAGQL